MCDPHPGARCSADTRRELEIARTRLKRASAALERRPDAAAVATELEKARSVEAVKLAAYDSSPEGQRTLVDEIRAAPSGAEQLRTRLYVGRATRAQQKRALAQSRGQGVDEENVAVARTLRRLRHPESMIVCGAIYGDPATMGFFVPSTSLQLRATSGRPDEPVAAARLAREHADQLRDPSTHLVEWHDRPGGVVYLAIARRFDSAEAAAAHAQRTHAGTYYDAQLAQRVSVKEPAR